MTGEAAGPLRVGLFPSVGRFGLHLMERFADGGPFRVVAATNPATLGGDSLRVANLATALGVRLVSTPQEFLQSDDIDVLWVTSHNGLRPDFATTGFDHPLHMIVETPFAMTSEMAETAFAAAAQRDRLFLVHHPRRADLDFRQALTVAEDRAIGTIRGAKFVSWSYGLPPSGATRGGGLPDSVASDDPQTTKVRLIAHALDQLVALIGDRPISVFAMGDSQTQGALDLWAGYSLSLRIVFEQGCQAEIDIRLNSPVPYQSGWLLTGERGGYANGRRFTLTDDGEVFDSPVAPNQGSGVRFFGIGGKNAEVANDAQLPPISKNRTPDPERFVAPADSDAEADQFEWLALQIRSGIRNVTEESRVRTVVALLDATQRSLNHAGVGCSVFRNWREES